MKTWIRSSASRGHSLLGKSSPLQWSWSSSSIRPTGQTWQERKRVKVPKVNVSAVKLDSVACWKSWVAMLGVRFKGLSFLAGMFGLSRVTPFNWYDEAHARCSDLLPGLVC